MINEDAKPLWLFRQSAVVPWRMHDRQIEVLLVTTANGKHWTIPKGVLEFGYTPWDSALKEAREEAGVGGRVGRNKLGEYEYRKWGGTCHVDVYPLEVLEVMQTWPEMRKRKRRWCTLDKCAKKIKHGGLLPVLNKLPRYLKQI